MKVGLFTQRPVYTMSVHCMCLSYSEKQLHDDNNLWIKKLLSNGVYKNFSNDRIVTLLSNRLEVKEFKLNE